MDELLSSGLLTGRLLDYCCGVGNDADILACSKYDPYYFPVWPDGLFDTITCIYALNAVRAEMEPVILDNIRSLLSADGNAFLAVRRDSVDGRGYQRDVRLPLEVVSERSGKFEIYRMRRN